MSKKTFLVNFEVNWIIFRWPTVNQIQEITSQYEGLWGYISHYFTFINLLASSYLNNNCIKGIKHTAHWINIGFLYVVIHILVISLIFFFSILNNMLFDEKHLNVYCNTCH